ncbi:hypothetical protein EDB84DRAFT_1560795 [Lactarius hengduanensis]|nr:hypothetical protein EDB84DRAFT_1560795 [Lactarius hengduanensis]
MLRKLVKRLTDIRGLLDRQDAHMLSVNERVAPEPSRLLSFLPCRARPHLSAENPIRRRSNALHDHITRHIGVSHHWGCRGFRSLNCGSLGSTDESDGPFLPSDRTPSTTGAHNTGGDTASEPALLQHSTGLQEELAAQLAQMAGQPRRNAEHVSGELVADQGVLRAAEEKVDANLDVMKRERVRLHDHRDGTRNDVSDDIEHRRYLRLRFWSCSLSFRFN